MNDTEVTLLEENERGAYYITPYPDIPIKIPWPPG